ncbi:MAG: T9SS type A sorting domain-containing protein, partial [Saprospiraceae bacterium]|nr:T9SS type A sorting domain-containing protein [Saprospiraceae bacterium]
LGDGWDWSAYDNCPDAPEERSTNTAPTAVLNLYPNPAKDAALLDLGYAVETGRATLRDMSGRTLKEWNLAGNRQVWLRWGRELPAGLYLVEVVADQAAPQVLKLAIKQH